MLDKNAVVGWVTGWLVALLSFFGQVSRAAAEGPTSYYVSAEDGDDAANGTEERPWKTIERATNAIQPGDAVHILPGVYRAQSFAFKPGGRDIGQRTVFQLAESRNEYGRAVLTGPNDEVPNFTLAANTRIEGLWIGGVIPDQAGGRAGSINQPGLEIVDCVFWSQKTSTTHGRSYQLLCGNTARNLLFMNNLLVHMGGDWLDHPIYISGGPPPTTQDCRFIGNVFVNGGGCPLHCWHKPANVTIVGNFTSGHEFSMVAQGQGHVVHHNIFWKPRGKADRPDWNWNALLPNDLLRFDHNILGSDHPIREGGKPQQPAVHNYSLAGLRGTQAQLIPVPATFTGRIPLINQTARDIDAAIGSVDRYFSTQSPKDIAEDRGRTLGRSRDVLRLDYKPTKDDLASRPVLGAFERCDCSNGRVAESGPPEARAQPERSTTAPTQTRKVMQPRTAPKPVASMLGYMVHRNPEHAREYGKYTNVVLDRGWVEYGDALIKEAEGIGLRVVLSYLGGEVPDAEGKAIQLARRYPEVVSAICWRDRSGGSTSSVNSPSIAKRVKEVVPGIEFWAYFGGIREQPQPIADNVDVVVLAIYNCTQPQHVQDQAGTVLDSWSAHLDGRPVLLQRTAWKKKPPGLVPKCEPGTMRMCAQVAKQHGCAGLLLHSYGGQKELAGVEANPAMVSEIREIARD